MGSAYGKLPQRARGWGEPGRQLTFDVCWTEKKSTSDESNFNAIDKIIELAHETQSPNVSTEKKMSKRGQYFIGATQIIFPVGAQAP